MRVRIATVTPHLSASLVGNRLIICPGGAMGGGTVVPRELKIIEPGAFVGFAGFVGTSGVVGIGLKVGAP